MRGGMEYRSERAGLHSQGTLPDTGKLRNRSGLSALGWSPQFHQAPFGDKRLEQRRMMAVPLPEVAVAAVGRARFGDAGPVQPIRLTGCERVTGKLGVSLGRNMGLDPIPDGHVEATVVVRLAHAPQPVFKLGDGDQRLGEAPGGEAAGLGEMLRDPDTHRRCGDDDRGVAIPLRIGFIEPRSAGRHDVLNTG